MIPVRHPILFAHIGLVFGSLATSFVIGWLSCQSPFILFLIAMSLPILVIILYARGRTSISIAILGLILFAGILRVALFSPAPETVGELWFEYLRRLELKQFPLLDLYTSPIPVIGYEPHSYMLLHFLSTQWGIEPVLASKFMRVLLGVLNTLLVLAIARRTTGSLPISMLAALLFTTNFLELWYMEGDQYKNFLGETFSLAFLALLVVIWDIKQGSERLPRGLVFFLCSLYLSSALSHRLYLFLIPMLLVFYTLNNVAITLVWKRRGLRLLMPLLTGFMAVLAATTCAKLPVGQQLIRLLNVPLLRIDHPDWIGLNFLQLLLLPGILFHNTWWLILTLGYLALYKEWIWQSRAALFVFSSYQFLFWVSRSFLLGSELGHDRFFILVTPFLSILTAVTIQRTFARLGFPLGGVFKAGIALALIAGSFVVINFSPQSGMPFSQILLATPDHVFSYIFGSSLTPDSFVSQTTKIVLVVPVLLVLGLPVWATVVRELRSQRVGFTQLENLTLAVVTGIVNLLTWGVIALLLAYTGVLTRSNLLTAAVLLATWFAGMNLLLALAPQRRKAYA